MSLTVVKTENKENAQVSVALAVERYEALRLLADAKIQFKNKNFSASKASLEKLFMYQQDGMQLCHK